MKIGKNKNSVKQKFTGINHEFQKARGGFGPPFSFQISENTPQKYSDLAPLSTNTRRANTPGEKAKNESGKRVKMVWESHLLFMDYYTIPRISLTILSRTT
jgi:hypothetical protein